MLWLSNEHNDVTIHCNKIPFSNFPVTEPIAFQYSASPESIYLRAAWKTHYFSQAGLQLRNLYVCVLEKFTASSEPAVSYMKYSYCFYSSTAALSTSGANRSMRVSPTSPVLFFKASWCQKQVTICLGFSQIHLIFLHWKCVQTEWVVLHAWQGLQGTELWLESWPRRNPRHRHSARIPNASAHRVSLVLLQSVWSIEFILNKQSYNFVMLPDSV